MRNFYIYIHCRPDGEPFYIGYSGNQRRCHNFTQRTKYHKHVVAKHGKENILIYTRNCHSESHAHANEKWMIAWCRAQGYRLTNMTAGGEGCSGRKLSEETKSKIGAANKGGIRTLELRNHLRELYLGSKRSDEVRKKISNGLLGRPVSFETRRKISESNTGKISSRKGVITSEITKRKISAANKGRKFSKEHCLKLSIAKQGKPWSEKRRRVQCHK